MKNIILTIFLMFPIITNGMEITCYSSGKQIYHGYSSHLYYNDNFIILYDNKINKSIYVRAECVMINSKLLGE
jgi:hypothetical protein